MHQPPVKSTKENRSVAQKQAGGKTAVQFRAPNPFAPKTEPVFQRKPVAQFNGWLSKLVELAKNNPKTAIATTAIMAFGGLYLYYRNRQQNNDNQQHEEEVAPDGSTALGLAGALGISRETLVDHLENGALGDTGPVDVNRIFRVFRDVSNDNPLLGIVPPSLIRDLDGTNAEKAAEIFRRLNLYNFRYTGNASSALRGFAEKAGDCMTLANMFIYALKAAGINDGVITDDDNKMLVAPRAIHGRNTVGNVLNQQYWFFHDHHWVVSGGTRYDLLFMITAAPTVYTFSSTQVYKGVSYDVFQGNRCMIHESEITDKNMAVDLGGTMGVTRDSVAEIQQYIDEHPAR